MEPEKLLSGLPNEAKILFVRLRSLGDTVLSTPLYSALKAWRADLRISVLVESPNDEVLHNNPDLDQVISIAGTESGLPGSLYARWVALKRVHAGRFDCCINLHGGSTSAWLTALSGAEHRVGLNRFRKSFVYNVRIDVPERKPTGEKQHTVEYQMEWLRRLGLPQSPIPPLRLVPDPSLRLIVRNKLLNAGLDPARDYMVIHPASKFHTKEWTADGFAEVTDDLNTGHGAQVVLVGGPGEGAKLKQVAARCQTSPMVFQGLSVSELVCLIQRAKLFIGNDSGPTHIAAALQVPVVVLFGSSDSYVWYPWKVAFQKVQNPFECNPCPGYRCLVYKEPRCILSITPEQVKAAVRVLLSAAPRTARE
jgi:ADP-heptose:LPS heptosyltransferase